MKQETAALLQINIAALLLSMVGLFGKWIALPATIIILGRAVFSGMTLFLILKLFKQDFRLKSRKELLYLTIAGIFFGVHMVAFFESVQASTIAIAMITIFTYPVWIAFLEPIMLREKIVGKNILLALVAFAGVALLVPNFELDDGGFKGVLWGLLAALTFSIETVINRKYAQAYSGSLITFYETTIAAVVLLPFLFMGNFTIKATDLILMAILGVVFTAIAYTLFVNGLRYIKAQKAGLISTIEPVYSILFAAILLGEMPGLRTFAGAALILGTAIFAQLKMKN